MEIYRWKICLDKKLIVIFVILLIILNTELLYHEILAVYNSRESSNEARFIIYQESIDKVLENNILFGYGISEYSVTELGSEVIQAIYHFL